MDNSNENNNATKTRSHNNWGHRQRLKTRYLKEGNFDAFATHEVLELLLFYVIPQKDTKPIAKALLEHFDGSLERVFSAPIDELKKVKGIKDEAGLFLTLFNSLERFRKLNSEKLPDRLNSSEKVIEYLKPHYYGKTTETSMLLCLDRQCRVIGCHMIQEGTINYTALNPRKIMDIVLRCNAPCVILSHNHPVGGPTPSQNDIESTRTIIRMLSQIEVKVIDHVIISPNGECSMADTARYAMMFK